MKRLTKWLTAALAAFLLCPAVSAAPVRSGEEDGPAPFSDVPAAHWAYDAVTAAAGRGIAAGYGDGTFRPDLPATYAHFAALLARACYPSDLAAASGTAGWAAPYTETLAKHGILSAAEAPALCQPLDPSVMAQMMVDVLIDRGVLSAGALPAVPGLEALSLLEEVPDEYRAAVSAACALGLLEEAWDIFSGGDAVSRAQACAAVVRLLPYITPEDVSPVSGCVIGAELTVDSATPERAEITLANRGSDTFSYAGVLRLSRYEDGAWWDVPLLSPDGTVTDIAILRLLPPGQTKAVTFSTAFYYGPLPQGCYRLTLTLSQDARTYTLFDLFSLPQGA